MPVLPIAALLASYAAWTLVDQVRAWRPRLAPVAGAVAAAGLLVQPLWTSIRNDVVLSRDDTRSVTRAWMVAHVPAGSKITLEPVVSNTWLSDPGGRFLRPDRDGSRWRKFQTGLGASKTGRNVRVEDYERMLNPSLIDSMRGGGFCWVVIGSTQYGRALNDPSAVPDAIAYYRRLRASADLVFRASPYGAGQRPVKFNFDWSFDYYPSAYHRPGPEMAVYHLRGCRQRS
jgi:hypothetical protein